MNRNRIVSTGPISPEAREILGRFGQIEVISETDEEGLISLMKGTIALIVRGVIQIPARVINAADALRVIGRTGSGYENIDITAATRRGIPVVFAPGAGARAVAEGAMAMILALAKRLFELDRKTRAGEWSVREDGTMGDLQGTVLGIIGLGRIGREVARLTMPFDMRVLAYDSGITKNVAESVGATLVDLDTLLRESDFVSIHAPLNQETRGLFDRHRISLMKQGAVLINLARGGIIESLDVIFEALNTGRLSAAGLDVYPSEPPAPSHPIFKHPNLLCTPHVMGLSAKGAQATFSMVSHGIADVLEGRIPKHVINPQVFGDRIEEARE